jgi:hypothetical protein
MVPFVDGVRLILTTPCLIVAKNRELAGIK